MHTASDDTPNSFWWEGIRLTISYNQITTNQWLIDAGSSQQPMTKLSELEELVSHGSASPQLCLEHRTPVLGPVLGRCGSTVNTQPLGDGPSWVTKDRNLLLLLFQKAADDKMAEPSIAAGSSAAPPRHRLSAVGLEPLVGGCWKRT